MARQPKEEFNAKREIIPIIFASILFILGIVFRKKLHHTPKNNFTKGEILQLAAVAESQSNHPIAVSILEAYGRPPSLEVNR